MVNRAEGVKIFKKRWEEAKASGCTAVLFEADKWALIDMLIDEAEKTQTLRRELIAALVELKKRGEDEDAVEDDEKTANSGSSYRSTARAA